MKRNGHRIIRTLDIDRERRIEVQRYRCSDCQRSFTFRRSAGRSYTQRFEKEIVRRHVEGRGSYRVLAKWVYETHRRRISPTSLQKMVEKIGRCCKTAFEMSQELQPRWDGFVLLDEKMCSVRGEQQWFYLGVDRTGDIFHCRAVNELTITEAAKFLEDIKLLPIRVRGIVTDLDAALTGAVRVVYKETPHQYCLKHALTAIEKLIGYTELRGFQRTNRDILRTEFYRLRDRKGVWVKRAREEFFKHWETTRQVSERYQGIQALRDLCHQVLFAKSEQQAKEYLVCLGRSRSYPRVERRKAFAFIQRHWNHLMMYHRVPGLPRTTNLIENVNRQLERRYKTIEAFQHPSTAIYYTNLLVAYLRQKPYTDCRGHRKCLNGKSRLGAAKVKSLNLDWLKNCVKNNPN